MFIPIFIKNLQLISSTLHIPHNFQPDKFPEVELLGQILVFLMLNNADGDKY